MVVMADNYFNYLKTLIANLLFLTYKVKDIMSKNQLNDSISLQSPIIITYYRAQIHCHPYCTYLYYFILLAIFFLLN